ncbi:hypothetical protein PIB30_070357 [Stylosanthes scabra]|uniref:Transposase-associated domain-containing protein n=1 Tax=Stylosanthes scabra TaxID=79078 RepID=A0ABU6ZM89_9FABA|nr:hypothetical protein [Stylosanthes scabra]
MEENNQSWMYDRVYPNRGGLKPLFITGLGEFLNTCATLEEYNSFGKVRCPCGKYRHGEQNLEVANRGAFGGYCHENDEGHDDVTWDDNLARYESIVVDTFPHENINMDHDEVNDEKVPNPDA